MSNTDNHIDYIEFPARDATELAAAKAFYGNVFGWSYTMYGNDYADTPDSGTESGINAEDPAPAPLIVIHVADLDTAYYNIQAAGGTITKEIFTFPGGKRFHFQDPAGNNLAAWSE